MNPRILEDTGKRRLLKTLVKVGRYADFEKKVLSCFRWYQLPIFWTRKELREFYYTNGGR